MPERDLVNLSVDAVTAEAGVYAQVVVIEAVKKTSVPLFAHGGMRVGIWCGVVLVSCSGWTKEERERETCNIRP